MKVFQVQSVTTEGTMIQEMQRLEWYCGVCGVTGTAEMWADLGDYGKVDVLVRSHSLKSPGCCADARKSLLCRDVSDREIDQKLATKLRERAVSATTAVKKWRPWR
jgi:hypothetical protein